MKTSKTKPASRQLRWRQKMRRAGRCIQCGAVAQIKLRADGKRQHLCRCTQCTAAHNQKD